MNFDEYEAKLKWIKDDYATTKTRIKKQFQDNTNRNRNDDTRFVDVIDEFCDDIERAVKLMERSKTRI